jgi:multiple sugar transport system permease protein
MTAVEATIAAEPRRPAANPRTRSRAAWGFVAPALIAIAVFFAVPVFAALLLSLTDFDIYALADLRNLRFVGLDNYVNLFSNPLFWGAMKNTGLFALIGVPASIAASLAAALLLNARIIKWRPVWRVAFFAPFVTTLVATAVLWNYLLHTRYGLINWALTGVGIPPIHLSGQPRDLHPGHPDLRRLEDLRLQHADLSGRPSDRAGRAARGRAHRRGPGLDALPARHPAGHRPDPAARLDHLGGQLLPAVRRTLRHDPGRPGPVDRDGALLHVRRGLQMVEPGVRLGGRLHPLSLHPRRHPGPAGRRPPSGGLRMSRRFDLKAVLANLAVVLLVVVVLFPLVWMVSVSFMSQGEAATFPPPLWPSKPTLEHYRDLFVTQGMGRYMLNSLILATLATILALLFTVPAGYAFAKLRFAGRDRLFQLLVAALVVPAQIGTLPLFLMLKSMGLVNTYAGALVPWLASIFGLFLVRQYALSIPDEMLEAARVDGATEGQIFRRVVLPTLQPIVVTLALFVFLGSWNDFLWPLIVLTDQSNYTLPVALAAMSREHVQDAEMMMAGAVLTVAPVLILFLALQRYYIRGMLAGSVKG